MQTKFKIIETEQYWLAVSDEEINEFGTNLKEGTKVFYNLTGYETIFIKTAFNICNGNFQSEFCKKIIAYQPKNNAPELDLPLLPEMAVEDDVERLAEQLLTSHSDFKAEGMSEYQNGRFNGIIEGLNYKSATKKYSEEDLRRVFKEGEGNIDVNGCKLDNSEKVFNKVIQSLKQPTPTWFVAEMEITKSEVFRENDNVPYATLKTTTINGKTYLVGKFENE